MREAASSGCAASEKPTGRSLVDFSGVYEGTLNGLYPAEEALLIHAKNGSVYVVDKRRPCVSLPEGKGGSTERPGFIRSAFIRFLALGGDGTHPVHEKGVQVEGAWIGYPLAGKRDLDATLTTKDIDLESCKNVGRIVLQRCHIDGDIILRDAHTRTIDLQGSYVAGGIEARRARIEGSLYLRYKQQDDGGRGMFLRPRTAWTLSMPIFAGVWNVTRQYLGTGKVSPPTKTEPRSLVAAQ